MIFCRELLFLHVPKTGGMSVSEYLVRVLPPPVYYTRPDGHGLLTVPEGVVEMSGKRHETLAQACDVVAAHGFRLPEFRAILATIRNPYDLEVSRYTHLQQPYSVNRGRIWAAAMNEDFPTFARTTITHLNKRIEDYFLVDGERPPNLITLRFERLAHDLQEALAQAGIDAKGDLPRTNTSRHDSFLSYYTREAERAVYEKYRWLFDEGFYPRMSDAELARAEQAEYGHKLPLAGPVAQVGPSRGLWPDLWVGERLKFRVKAARRIGAFTVKGAVPASVGSGVMLTASVGGQTVASMTSRGAFVWQVSCPIEVGAPVDVEISAAPTWSAPTDGVGGEARKLAFRLSEIDFQEAVPLDASSAYP